MQVVIDSVVPTLGVLFFSISSLFFSSRLVRWNIHYIYTTYIRTSELSHLKPRFGYVHTHMHADLHRRMHGCMLHVYMCVYMIVIT